VPVEPAAGSGHGGHVSHPQGFGWTFVAWVSMDERAPGHLGEHAMAPEPASAKQRHYLQGLLNARGVRENGCQALLSEG